jgi:molecular chaperone GrpE
MKKTMPEQIHAAQAISAQLNEAPDGADELRSEIERLKEENERLNHELRREHEMYIRNLADFDNYRRRVERERAQAARAGKRELVLPLLEVMDDFERAIERAKNDPQLEAAGFRAVYSRLAGLLAAQGVAVKAIA